MSLEIERIVVLDMRHTDLLADPLHVALLPGRPHPHAKNKKVKADDWAQTHNVDITEERFHFVSETTKWDSGNLFNSRQIFIYLFSAEQIRKN